MVPSRWGRMSSCGHHGSNTSPLTVDRTGVASDVCKGSPALTDVFTLRKPFQDDTSSGWMSLRGKKPF